MPVDERRVGDVAVLTVLDKALTSGPDVALLQARVQGLMEAGVRKMVVDLSGVKWCGSAAIGVLIAGLTALRNAGGDLRLAGVTERIANVLKATGLAGVFQTLDTADRAVASFRG